MTRRLACAAGRVALAGLALLNAVPAAAVDYSLSGFATLGYARSNQPYTYQRFIDDDGTIKRDSVAGLQVDAKLNNEFAATLQVKAAAADDSDRRYEASVSWAFVSWRPTNDWLIRVGKQRLPLYLNSENYDVGATYDLARLPTEMYSLVPSNDAYGVSIDRTLKIGAGELSIEGYIGRTSNHYRIWQRDDVPGVQQPGPTFPELDFRGGGLVATWRGQDDLFRIGVHRAIVRLKNGTPLVQTYPFVSFSPGIGYYQVSPLLDGPGVPTRDSVVNTTVTLGADVALPRDFRVVAEFARSVASGSDVAPKGNRGYLALLKRLGKWTPYVTYAFLRSPQDQRDFYTRVDGNTVPALVPDAAILNASQRIGADQINAYHQTSWAVGTSYSFSATSKAKAEFMRTRTGDVSRLVDPLPGEDSRNRKINVFSLSYSVVY